ncbi:MAG: dihydrolipoamide acetyltransferase family protein [Acidimicrobiia bacterium]
MSEFRMPSLGADMEFGTIIEWLVAPGDTVHYGDIVAVVHTEKADIEVEVFDDGVIGELLVPVGEEVEVGTPLATVVPAGAPVPAPAAPAPPVATPAEPTAAVATPLAVIPAPAESPTIAPVPARARVSPRARRLAAERGVDVAQLTAADHVVVSADVERVASGAPPRATDQHAAMRHAIAVAMAKSNREIPHYHLLHHTPLSHMLAWLEARNAARPVEERVLPAAVFCRAVVLAISRVPGINGHWIDDSFRPSEHVNLGFAVSMRGGGLIAPAILDAERLDLDATMAAIRDLSSRVRSGRLRGREMTDATITVTNLGERGVEVVHGVIYPPQVALVGFGTVVSRPWVENGDFAARPVVAVSLAGDHRASDGHLGARFLAEIDELLRTPEQL